MLSKKRYHKNIRNKRECLSELSFSEDIVLNGVITKWVYLEDNALCIDPSLSVHLLLYIL